jgi:hypothetical protein
MDMIGDELGALALALLSCSAMAACGLLTPIYDVQESLVEMKLDCWLWFVDVVVARFARRLAWVDVGISALGRRQILRVAIGDTAAGFERLHVLYSHLHHFCKPASHACRCFEDDEVLGLVMTAGKQCCTGVRHRLLVPQSSRPGTTLRTRRSTSPSVKGLLICFIVDIDKVILAMEEKLQGTSWQSQVLRNSSGHGGKAAIYPSLKDLALLIAASGTAGGLLFVTHGPVLRLRVSENPR